MSGNIFLGQDWDASGNITNHRHFCRFSYRNVVLVDGSKYSNRSPFFGFTINISGLFQLSKVKQRGWRTNLCIFSNLCEAWRNTVSFNIFLNVPQSPESPSGYFYSYLLL